MSSTSRVHKVAVTLAAIAVLLAGVGVAGTRVLCFGNDGHVAIEYTDGATCAPSHCEKAQSPGTDPAPQLGGTYHCHCGPCVDIPLGIVEIAKLPVPVRAPSFAKFYFSLEHQLGVFGSRTGWAAGPKAAVVPSADSTLANLLTVRLLT